MQIFYRERISTAANCRELLQFTLNWRLKSKQSRPTVHTNPSRKQSFFKIAFQTREIWKRRSFIFVWTENILKPELFENGGVTILTWTWFLWLNFLKYDLIWSMIVAFLNFFGLKYRRKKKWCVFRVKPFGGRGLRNWLQGFYKDRTSANVATLNRWCYAI